MPKKRLLLLFFIVISLSLMTYQSNRHHLLPLKSIDHVLNGFHEIKNSLKDSVNITIQKDAHQGRRKLKT